MLAASVVSFGEDLGGLRIGDAPNPEPPPEWAVVDVRAAALNHHDLWSLRGVGISEDRLPMILGCDAAGVDANGNAVIVHAMVGGSVLSEHHAGTFAEKVAVPEENLVPKPSQLSFVEAACLPTAWLTAYRMLFVRACAVAGSTVLVQGAGGGVATALVQLGAAADIRMWVTSGSAAKRERAVQLGAEAAFEPGARLPRRVDAVMETVGAATWSHSIRSVRDGGTIVVSGATTGDASPAELQHLFFRQLSVLGSTMGTRDELEELVRFCVENGVHPLVDETIPLSEARRGFEKLRAGEALGKIVFTVGDSE